MLSKLDTTRESDYHCIRTTITKKYPLVVKYIGEIRDEYNKKYEVDYGKHIAELGKIRQAALEKGAWSAAVNAEVARGKGSWSLHRTKDYSDW